TAGRLRAANLGPMLESERDWRPVAWRRAARRGTSMALLFTLEDHIATITINRPEVRNALDPATMAELADAWRRVRDDPEIWVAILTGAGDRAFCAGADLMAPADPTTYQEYPGGLQTYFPFDLKG